MTENLPEVPTEPLPEVPIKEPGMCNWTMSIAVNLFKTIKFMRNSSLAIYCFKLKTYRYISVGTINGSIQSLQADGVSLCVIKLFYHYMKTTFFFSKSFHRGEETTEGKGCIKRS